MHCNFFAAEVKRCVVISPFGSIVTLGTGFPTTICDVSWHGFVIVGTVGTIGTGFLIGDGFGDRSYGGAGHCRQWCLIISIIE